MSSRAQFKPLNALVVDDFPSFRRTVTSMLSTLGMDNIDQAGTADEALSLCQNRRYNILLSDYNLGRNQNGQHLLESLKLSKLIGHESIFLMMTAEASQAMVMAALDYYPDDYLMKPFNLALLEKRLSRLLHKKATFSNIEVLIENGDTGAAIQQLEQLAKQDSRYRSQVKKLLGETYIKANRTGDAEALFRDILKENNLDWALIGLGRSLTHQNKLEEAQQAFEEVIANNRLNLEAYDGISIIFQRNQNNTALLDNLKRVVKVSPSSIQRQRILAATSEICADFETMLDASFQSVKLGEQSFVDNPDDSITFLRAAGNAIETEVEKDKIHLASECEKQLKKLKKKPLAESQLVQAKLMTARVLEKTGQIEKARQIEQTIKFLDVDDSEVAIAQFIYLNSSQQYEKADKIIKGLITRSKNNAEKMKKLDRILCNPRDSSNRKIVSQLNDVGIQLHKQGDYHGALKSFDKALVIFPRNIAVHLNKLQSLTKLRALKPDSANKKALKSEIAILTLLLPDFSKKQRERFKIICLHANNVETEDKSDPPLASLKINRS